ncbi:unnamed protein product [Didymodactylos carnosus]|uniref:Uncharacterized protein n=1 Tax=Didymodactylos carnosus TaxID=1234261 RepID=A0A813Q0I8_9BILA|nr:unnamed protein product [Didymodactylos carnosus]CAF1216370.1 unnamed protein product [Didymodactylos carnosus]CAF3540333.1 unnamed protein product [Didymodactylos carnosus]CAF4024808.1 unnamed protein product [Didymodactylos carnosus]
MEKEVMTTQTIKPKTLTLLELCQSITNLRSSTNKMSLSPNTSHILTRRLYLHPLSKSKSSSLADIETRQHLNLEKKKLTRDRTHASHRGLAILSSRLPLKTRQTTVLNNLSNESHHRQIKHRLATDLDIIRNESVQFEDDDEYDYLSTPASSSTIITTSHSSKSDKWMKFNIWQHIDTVLQRPSPKQPPSTPLDMLSDYYIQGQSSLKNSMATRHSLRDKTIDESEEFFY